VGIGVPVTGVKAAGAWPNYSLGITLPLPYLLVWPLCFEHLQAMTSNDRMMKEVVVAWLYVISRHLRRGWIKQWKTLSQNISNPGLSGYWAVLLFRDDEGHMFAPWCWQLIWRPSTADSRTQTDVNMCMLQGTTAQASAKRELILNLMFPFATSNIKWVGVRTGFIWWALVNIKSGKMLTSWATISGQAYLTSRCECADVQAVTLARRVSISYSASSGAVHIA
jgi:hypothetical protein